MAETAERTAAQLREQTERAEKAAATLAERETALEEAKSREKELEKTLEALAMQLAQLKTEHAKNADYVKTLLHSNKMKDRGRNAERSEV